MSGSAMCGIVFLLGSLFIRVAMLDDTGITQLYMSIQRDVSFAPTASQAMVERRSYVSDIQCVSGCLRIADCRLVMYNGFGRICTTYNATKGTFTSSNGFVIYTVDQGITSTSTVVVVTTTTTTTSTTATTTTATTSTTTSTTSTTSTTTTTTTTTTNGLTITADYSSTASEMESTNSLAHLSTESTHALTSAIATTATVTG